MADEAPISQNLAPNVDQAPASVDATIESIGEDGTASSCNNNNVAETSGLTSDGEMDKSLEFAEELMERGSKANKEQDYSEATDCFSRALEIRRVRFRHRRDIRINLASSILTNLRSHRRDSFVTESNLEKIDGIASWRSDCALRARRWWLWPSTSSHWRETREHRFRSPEPRKLKTAAKQSSGISDSRCKKNSFHRKSQQPTPAGRRESPIDRRRKTTREERTGGGGRWKPAAIWVVFFFKPFKTKKGILGKNTSEWGQVTPKVAHYGELAPECVRSYYKYGCALLYKAQEEADPLVSGAVKKKEVGSEHDSEKESAKAAESVETSVTSIAKEGTSNIQEVGEDGGDEEDQEEDADGSDSDDAGADEDESDLDLAWKMLDVARAIAEKQPGDTMEKVDILSALAEVALEREDVETSLSDYLKALSMLERLAEPDSRCDCYADMTGQNCTGDSDVGRICLCLEIGSKGQEAIPYCEKAISVCKSRLQRLTSEIESSSMVSANSEPVLLGRQVSNASQTADNVADKEKEIEILTGLSTELEKKATDDMDVKSKLEDLQQIVSNPSSILSDILGMMAAKGKGGQSSAAAPAAGLSSSRLGTANSSGFESPTVSTAHTNGSSAGGGGVTHLGVVGRGVKRVSMSSATTESNPAKKPATDPSADGGSSNAA
ncbi:hypothetical protein OSB04_007434 [Centaurea solstitialis]|uniref:Uncharacterized protein n=1 Tax=Centaurea solstitialis TaxID=347529 RepID=A0AA38TJW8_9ASTR|nr:hypothetical protein OSB04_007434 [Centaurea solstitialis]